MYLQHSSVHGLLLVLLLLLLHRGQRRGVLWAEQPCQPHKGVATRVLLPACRQLRQQLLRLRSNKAGLA